MTGGRSTEAEHVAHDDVRLRGFSDRATVEDAQAWVDGRAGRLATTEVPLESALGRILAVPLVATTGLPPHDRAGVDGYAVRAADTVGASAHNPLLLRLEASAAVGRSGHAVLLAAGTELPLGTNAVLGFESAQTCGPEVEVIASVANGCGVEGAAQQVRTGARLLEAGRHLGARELALLASLGFTRVAVVEPPRVRLVVAGPKGRGAPDVDGPLLRALVARDGGTVEVVSASADLGAALRAALRSPAPDLVLVAGRTGTGPDDSAPSALSEVDRLELHGVALRPGGSAGLGVAGEVPVALLPGDPLACLVAYELLAGRLVRRLSGRRAGVPHGTVEATLARKLVSAVGVVEVCQVRMLAGRVEPLGVAEFGGLAAAARADGFVVIPAPLEGYAPGAPVTVHLY